MDLVTIEKAIHSWVTTASGLAANRVIHEDQDGQRPTGTWIGISIPGLRRKGQDWRNTEDNLLVIADDAVDVVDFANDELDVTAHAYVSGDGPFQLTTMGTLPTGIALATDYWIIVINSGTVQLAATFPDSMNTPVPISFSDAGAGTHTIEKQTTTARAGQEIAHTVRGPRLMTIALQVYGGDATGAGRATSLLNDVMTKVRFPSIQSALQTAGIGIGVFSDISELSVPLGPKTDRRGLMTILVHLAEEITETGTYIETAETTEDPPIS